MNPQWQTNETNMHNAKPPQSWGDTCKTKTTNKSAEKEGVLY